MENVCFDGGRPPVLERGGSTADAFFGNGDEVGRVTAIVKSRSKVSFLVSNE